MKKILIAACFTVFGVCSYAAPAKLKNNTFNYNFVEAHYIDMRNDNVRDNRYRGKADLDGLRIRGSFALDPSFNIIGSLLDTGSNRYDLTAISVGGAYHQPLQRIENMPLDLVIRAEIEHVQVDFDGLKKKDNETGILLSGGLQMLIINHLQAFSDVSISSNDYREVSLSLGARYEFVPAFEASAGIEVGDIDLLSVGFRYNF